MRSLVEKASVVFREVEGGKFDVYKSRDGQLTVGGKYSEDFVKFYRQVNEDVLVLDGGEITPDAFTKEPAPLKVGDYAKVVGGAPANIGVIAEVTRLCGYQANLKPVGPSYLAMSSVDLLVRATDEEVAAAKAEATQHKEEAKWAKIGRKPREFKEGDIAEVLCQVHADIPIGTIGTITKVDDDETVRVGANGVTIGNWHHLSEVKLITPVEARFDRA